MLSCLALLTPALASLPLASLATRPWYALPLIVSISLVYAATRHENPREIVSHAARFGGWVLVFIAIVTAALMLMLWLE